MLVTEHFSLEEMTHTDQRGPDGELLPNHPPFGARLELFHLCSFLLEPIRALWGCPVRVNSGYRSEVVQRGLQGAKPGDPIRASQHTRGQAADIVPVGIPIADAFEAVWLSDLPYDQLIFEAVGSAWIHVSCSPSYRPPRRQALWTSDGKTYHPYTPHKARALVGA